MAEDGWIKLHRKIRNNILWKKKPFDKPRAWIDLLLRASHNNRNVLAGNRRIELKRGQIFISKKRLARDWGWSRTKVTNFLNVLEGKNRNKNNQMLTTSEPLCKNETPKKTPFGIIITLTNYEFYQTGIMKKDIKKDIKKTPKRHLKDTPPISNAEQEKVSKPPKNYKNVKNDKEVKNNHVELSKNITRLFSFWKKHLNHPKAILTKDRRTKIGARLREGYTIEQGKKAIMGCKLSSYHMGDNPQGRVYDSIELIFRNGDKIEQFINIYEEVQKHGKSRRISQTGTKRSGREAEEYKRLYT